MLKNELKHLESLLKRLREEPPPPERAEEARRELERTAARLEIILARGGQDSDGAQTRLSLDGDGAGYRIWCDGSCAPNPGPGGWAAIIENNGQRQEISGAAPASTNNIMELTAALEALRLLPSGAQAVLTTDSRYLKDGITKWLPGWKRKGWRKADGDPVLNQPLWAALDETISRLDVKFAWVRGHSGHPENERCDELANKARKAQL